MDFDQMYKFPTVSPQKPKHQTIWKISDILLFPESDNVLEVSVNLHSENEIENVVCF